VWRMPSLVCGHASARTPSSGYVLSLASNCALLLDGMAFECGSQHSLTTCAPHLIAAAIQILRFFTCRYMHMIHPTAAICAVANSHMGRNIPCAVCKRLSGSYMVMFCMRVECMAGTIMPVIFPWQHLTARV